MQQQNASEDFGDYGRESPLIPGQNAGIPQFILPKAETKPGWMTSSGQLTGLITLVSIVLSTYLGWTWATPEALNTLYGAIAVIIGIIGPLVLANSTVKNYTNSRGKIESNAIWAGAETIKGTGGEGSLAQPVGFAGGLGGLGKIFKKPGTYIKLGKVVAPIFPGGGIAGRVLDSIDGEDDVRAASDDEITQAFSILMSNDKRIVARLKVVEEKLGINKD